MDRSGALVRIATAVCCASLGLTACGEAEPRPAALPPGPQARLDLGVVGVGARVGSDNVLGSGFVIDGDRGLVVTTAHTVWGARSLKLSTALGVLHGRIVARAPCDDLAVLEVHPRIPGLVPLPTAPAGSQTRGQLLRALGRRLADIRTATPALATIPVRTTAGAPSRGLALPLPKGAVQLDSPLVPEIAGGPVVDAAGRLVGMASTSVGPATTGPSANIPWPLIKQRLAQLKPGPRRVFVGWAEQYRCVGRQHAYARSLHTGYRASDARLNAPIAPSRLPGTEGLDG
jgi:S1-C subfamily serine protease